VTTWATLADPKNGQQRLYPGGSDLPWAFLRLVARSRRPARAIDAGCELGNWHANLHLLCLGEHGRAYTVLDDSGGRYATEGKHNSGSEKPFEPCRIDYTSPPFSKDGGSGDFSEAHYYAWPLPAKWGQLIGSNRSSASIRSV